MEFWEQIELDFMSDPSFQGCMIDLLHGTKPSGRKNSACRTDGSWFAQHQIYGCAKTDLVRPPKVCTFSLFVHGLIFIILSEQYSAVCFKNIPKKKS